MNNKLAQQWVVWQEGTNRVSAEGPAELTICEMTNEGR